MSLHREKVGIFSNAQKLEEESRPFEFPRGERVLGGEKQRLLV